jgi:hypothetical protein
MHWDVWCDIAQLRSLDSLGLHGAIMTSRSFVCAAVTGQSAVTEFFSFARISKRILSDPRDPHLRMFVG